MSKNLDKKEKVHIYINKDSGTVVDIGVPALEALIMSSGMPVEHLYFLDTPSLLEKVSNVDERAFILIGGGDGTIKSCAEILMDKDVAFGILPLGTMNLLAKDLGIPEHPEQALCAYAQGFREHDIDVGEVNGEIFLCCVGLGTMPETSEYREKHRGESQPILIPRVTAYMLQQMDRVNHRKLTLYIDGIKRLVRTAALVVSNNTYKPQGQWMSGDNFKRNSLQDGVMGVYSAAPYTFWDKFRLLFRLGNGDWKRDSTIKEWTCENLTVQLKDKDALLSFDGETKRISSPLSFSIRKRALSLIVPEGGAC